MASPWWMTFKQAQERDGHVSKGERGAMTVKYGEITLHDELVDESGKPMKGLYLRSFTVFKASQIEGVEFPALPGVTYPNQGE